MTKLEPLHECEVILTNHHHDFVKWLHIGEAISIAHAEAVRAQHWRQRQLKGSI